MTTYKEILSQIEALQRQSEDARVNEVAHALSQIKQTMADYGITAEDLKPTRKQRVKKPAGIAMYRDPASGKEWSGRGRAPGWLAGKDKNQFLA